MKLRFFVLNVCLCKNVLSNKILNNNTFKNYFKTLSVKGFSSKTIKMSISDGKNIVDSAVNSLKNDQDVKCEDAKSTALDLGVKQIDLNKIESHPDVNIKNMDEESCNTNSDENLKSNMNMELNDLTLNLPDKIVSQSSSNNENQIVGYNICDKTSEKIDDNYSECESTIALAKDTASLPSNLSDQQNEDSNINQNEKDLLALIADSRDDYKASIDLIQSTRDTLVNVNQNEKTLLSLIEDSRDDYKAAINLVKSTEDTSVNDRLAAKHLKKEKVKQRYLEKMKRRQEAKERGMPVEIHSLHLSLLLIERALRVRTRNL